jgi:putative membrane protein
MSPGLKAFLKRWLVTTVAVVVAAHIVSGIRYDSYLGLLVASFVLGILNAFLRPLLLLLSLPLLLFTLGLFTLIINALLLRTVGLLVQPFHVDGFWPAFWGALVISLVSMVLNSFLGTDRNQTQIRGNQSSPRPSVKDDGGGPIIDV